MNNVTQIKPPRRLEVIDLAVRLEGIVNALALITEQASEADGEQLQTALAFIVRELERFQMDLGDLPEADTKEAS